MHVFRKLLVPAFISALALLGPAATPAFSQTPAFTSVPSRVIGHVDDTQLVKLPGNTHLLDPNQLLERIVLVLQRSPEQQQALDAFNARQYDPQSPDFHHWLHAEEFGQLYGPSDADMAAITSWLQNHGFQIYTVSKGRVTIEFTGTVAQVQNAFHLEMHRYVVNGEQHIANDRDPSIPVALAPVVTGIASLHDFFGKPQSWFGSYVHHNTRTGVTTLADLPQQPKGKGEANLNRTPVSNPGSGSKGSPQFSFTDGDGFTREDLAPYDFAAIYNIGSLWSAGTTGKGVDVAISAGGDIEMSDVSTYRTAFNVQPTNNLPVVIHNGTDPGINGYQGENTEDVEMVGAAAPGATVDLVVSADTSTTGGYQLSDAYIVDNEVAPIMSASYGTCELSLGTAGNAAFNKIWQQGATEGISIFESSGDQGSAGCSSQDTAAPTADQIGLQVNGMASSPYVTAVGGTDLAWYYTQRTIPASTYWNTSNTSNLASAKGYMPEIAWNTTCANPLLLNVIYDSSNEPFPSSEALCNAALAATSYNSIVDISSGSGGASHCTTPSGTSPSDCSGGYAKPSWQTGSGVPADGKRDVPDMAMFASYGYGNFYATGLDIPSSARIRKMSSSRRMAVHPLLRPLPLVSCHWSCKKQEAPRDSPILFYINSQPSR
jgi:subtilase family serine protease